jgi:hypothetical protein
LTVLKTAQRARNLWPPVTPEPVRRVESTCDIVHPRPKTFWVVIQRSVVNMEAQVAFEADQKEKEIRAQGIAAGHIFDRSDDDEIVSMLLNFWADVNILCTLGRPSQAPQLPWTCSWIHLTSSYSAIFISSASCICLVCHRRYVCVLARVGFQKQHPTLDLCRITDRESGRYQLSSVLSMARTKLCGP